MNWKTLFNIIIALAVTSGLLCGTYLLRENYEFSLDFYNECNRMSIQSRAIVDSIDFLELKFENGDIDDLSRDRHSFDVAFQEVYLHFRTELLNDITSEYYQRFEEIYNQTVLNDEDNQKLIKLFTDPEESQKLFVLKGQMELMANTFMEFSYKYDMMTKWERCFTSWNNERKALAEKLKISQSLLDLMN